MSRINYGGIDVDVVVNFKSEGASNKIQLWINVSNKSQCLPPISHSTVCELCWFFGDYHIPQREIKIGPIRVELKRRHRGFQPPYRQDQLWSTSYRHRMLRCTRLCIMK